MQERLTCFMGFGFSSDVLCHMIRLRPTILNQSQYQLQEKINILLNLGYSLESLKSFPSYLCYSLEHRIKPRCRLQEWLRKNEVIKEKYKTTSIFSTSDRKLLDPLVYLHPEAIKVFQSFRPKSGKAQ